MSTMTALPGSHSITFQELVRWSEEDLVSLIEESTGEEFLTFGDAYSEM